MFTLIRPISAVVLAAFAYFAAQAYEPLYAPGADLGNFPYWAARISAPIGWVFLGGLLGRALWYSVYAAMQAVILSAVSIAGVLAVREVFIQGYHRRYTEVMDAITGYFGIVLDWLQRGLVADYLIFLAAGSVVMGIVLHGIWYVLERRRTNRR